MPRFNLRSIVPVNSACLTIKNSHDLTRQKMFPLLTVFTKGVGFIFISSNLQDATCIKNCFNRI